MSDLTLCYAARCPTCQGMVAVAAAPIEEPNVLQDALKSRRSWKRAGLQIEMVTVKAIHDGALRGHAEGCESDPRRKAKKRARQAARVRARRAAPGDPSHPALSERTGQS